MNTHFKVGGEHIVIDMGALEIMATTSGKDWANPLEGIENLKDRALLVLYGGLARLDELEGRPTSFTMEDCVKKLKTFAPGVIGQILKHYVEVMTIPGEDKPAEVTEEKKN